MPHLVTFTALNFNKDCPKDNFELHVDDITNVKDLPVLVDFDNNQIVGSMQTSEVTVDGNWICTALVDHIPDNMPYIVHSWTVIGCRQDEATYRCIRTLTAFSFAETPAYNSCLPYTVN